MSKKRSVFICSNCGYKTPKWLGKCPQCGEWDTFVEEISSNKKNISEIKDIELIPVNSIEHNATDRFHTNIGDLDRVLGGGIVPGSLILLGGDPGIGKSTIALQMANSLSAYGDVLYFSGEESPSQIGIRVKRIGIDRENIFIIPSTNIDVIENKINEKKPIFVIVDSIQTVEIEGIPYGSVSSLRNAILRLMYISKNTGVPILVIGHITKEGTIAGPKMVEHMVDVVLYLEGDKHLFYRILRSVKNRFGGTNEIGIFEMQVNGLLPVEDPSGFFIKNRKGVISGFANVCSVEGTRPIFMHVESLATYSKYGAPIRNATGINHRKLTMILAVLDKYLDIQTVNYDVFCNIPGGFTVNDTGIDLGIGVSIISSIKNIPISSDVVFIGELGLTGEIRPVWRMLDRVKEAYKRGFSKIIAPPVNNSIDNEYIKIEHIRDIITIKEEWKI